MSRKEQATKNAIYSLQLKKSLRVWVGFCFGFNFQMVSLKEEIYILGPRSMNKVLYWLIHSKFWIHSDPIVLVNFFAIKLITLSRCIFILHLRVHFYMRTTFFSASHLAQQSPSCYYYTNNKRKIIRSLFCWSSTLCAIYLLLLVCRGCCSWQSCCFIVVLFFVFLRSFFALWMMCVLLAFKEWLLGRESYKTWTCEIS